MRKSISAFVVVFIFTAQALADYTVDVLGESNGGGIAALIDVLPGDSFDGFVNLSGPGGTQSDSTVLRLVFDNPGLSFETGWFDWNSPYTTGGIDDFSVPSATDSGVIGADTFVDALAPTDIDVQFENLTNNFGDFFTTGTLISFRLTVPANAVVGSEYIISAAPDTFTDGASFVDASPGAPLTVRVIPEPTMFATVGILAFLLASARRK